MQDYLLLMHNDANPAAETDEAWEKYLAMLRSSGQFSGGSAIGAGCCVNHTGKAPPITRHLSGYLRISAASLEGAKQLLAGNPVLAAGGTVEIRHLPKDQD